MSKSILFAALVSSTAIAGGMPTTDEKKCQDYVVIDDNYKTAYENEHCLKAAEFGSGSAQFSIGMAHGFAGNLDLEEKYYRQSAAKGILAAYLALGHMLRNSNEDEAIYWYKRYIDAKAEGYGYAASLLVNIYKKKGDVPASEKWLKICQASPYGDNCGS